MTTTDPQGAGRVSVRRTVPGEGAACADVAAELRDAFFSTDPVQVSAARGVCASCPVQLRCLAGALARDEQWGVWGGWVFEPRTVQAVAQSVPDIHAHEDGGTSGVTGGVDRVRWEVLTTDLMGHRRRRGRFTTEAAAVIAADGWAREGRWRVRLGYRLGTVLDTLVPDSELHHGIAPPAVHADQPEPQLRVRPRRRVLRVDDAVQDAGRDARLDELLGLLLGELSHQDRAAGAAA